MNRITAACRLCAAVPFRRTILSALLTGIALFADTADTARAMPRYTGPSIAGDLAEPANRETSGMTASIRTPGLLWVHNDSGGDPVLYALHADGSLAGRLRVADAENHDWEDIASFKLESVAWLLAADTGDNHARRTQVDLHIVAEPDLVALNAGPEFSTRTAYSIFVRYEDGPRDCEAVAVDPSERAVYLLAKRDKIPQLYRVPLAPSASGQPVIARRVGLVSHLPHPDFIDKLTLKPARALRGEPTALDFVSDGSAALVLTYGGVFIFPRQAGTSWAETLAGTPEQLPRFSLPQAEGACFTDGGRHIYVVSENERALIRYDRTDSSPP